MATESTSTSTLVLVLLGALLALALLFVGGGMMGGGPMAGHGPMSGYGPMMGDSGMWGSGMGGTAGGWWFLVGLGMRFLFLVAIVGIAYLAYKRLTGAEDTDPAVEELRRAYARGDLTEEEYDERRERLDRDRPS